MPDHIHLCLSIPPKYGVAHTIGFLKENKKARGLGVGFYSSMPLAIVGLIVFIQLIHIITNK